MSIDGKKVQQAVKELRDITGLNQPHFGDRIGKSFGMIQAYESKKRPTGIVLGELASVAEKEGRSDLAELFVEALKVDLGPRVLEVLGKALGKTPIPEPKNISDNMRQEYRRLVEILVWIFEKDATRAISELKAQFDLLKTKIDNEEARARAEGNKRRKRV